MVRGVKRTLGITTGVAAVLIGGGIALGLALGGTGHSAPQPIVIHQVDEPVAASSSDSPIASPPTETVTSLVAAPTPTLSTTAAPATSPKKPPAAPAQQSAAPDGQHLTGIVGSDGVLRPGGTASDTYTPCQTPYALPNGKGGFTTPSVSNPCPN